jgi:hypothetical protein
MGVMSCSRKGCDNVMCDRHSFEFGYICRECFEELINSDLPIHAFMCSPKQNVKHREAREAYCNVIFDRC